MDLSGYSGGGGQTVGNFADTSSAATGGSDFSALFSGGTEL